MVGSSLYNAPFYGSTGSIALNAPIVGIEANPNASGYRFVAGRWSLYLWHVWLLRNAGFRSGYHSAYTDARHFNPFGVPRLWRGPAPAGAASSPTQTWICIFRRRFHFGIVAILGAATATATANGFFRAPGESAQVTLVAFDLGPCGTTYGYGALEWLTSGQTFNPNAYFDVCTGQGVGNGF